ncbi:MAG: hypothetical protein CBC48_12015 [bacterium TMED88]|nr:MAG: hypothetical protein CBC48_12015 [bacterium TMED88]
MELVTGTGIPCATYGMRKVGRHTSHQGTMWSVKVNLSGDDQILKTATNKTYLKREQPARSARQMRVMSIVIAKDDLRER